MYDNTHSRRNVLQGIGAAGIAGVAGVSVSSGTALGAAETTLYVDVPADAPAGQTVSADVKLSQAPDGVERTEFTVVGSQSLRFRDVTASQDFTDFIVNDHVEGDEDAFEPPSVTVKLFDSPDAQIEPGDTDIELASIEVEVTQIFDNLSIEFDDALVEDPSLELLDVSTDPANFQSSKPSDPPRLRVAFPQEEVAVGQTVDAAVVLEQVPYGYENAEFEVAASSSTWDAVDAAVNDDFDGGDIEGVDDGTASVSFEIWDDPSDPVVEAGDSGVVLATVTLEAAATDDSAGVGLDDVTYTDDSLEEVEVSTFKGTITVVEETAPTIGDSDQPAQDLNGDGLYRDVNGDGSFTNSDVTHFFSNYNSDEVQNNAALFDFDENGKLGQSDVITLFDEI